MLTLKDRYRLEARIGGGGMAEVWSASLRGAEDFSRPVAIKLMLPALSDDPAFGDMFINEARIAALLHHENIVSVLDFDRDESGRHFLVMELVKGVNLFRLMRSGPLPFEVTAFVVAEMLQGLDYAHKLEHDGEHLAIVHRDVSPHNVMLSWTGAVKLVDFGLAKAMSVTAVSNPKLLRGKVGYVSPEQAHGVQIDGRSDVFSTGIVLHELLTGRQLFQGASGHEILTQLLMRKVLPPRHYRRDVPADLDAVCMRMLERDRRRRYASAHHALEDLLGSSSANPRAELTLKELLRERFPDEAPQRAETEPVQFISNATVPLLPSEVMQGPETRAAMRELAAAPTRTNTDRRSPASGGPLPESAPADAVTRVLPGRPGSEPVVMPGAGPAAFSTHGSGPNAYRPGAGRRHRARAVMWIGGALLLSLLAILLTLYLTDTGDTGRPPASTPGAPSR